MQDFDDLFYCFFRFIFAKEPFCENGPRNETEGVLGNGLSLRYEGRDTLKYRDQGWFLLLIDNYLFADEQTAETRHRVLSGVLQF